MGRTQAAAATLAGFGPRMLGCTSALKSLAVAVSTLALLTTLTTLAGCPEEVACRDSDCAEGQVCGANGCTAVSPPSATGDLGRYTAVALSSQGRRVIATYDTTHGNLVLATERSDGALDKRVVDGFRVQDRKIVDSDSGKWASLVIGAGDVLHLSWHDQTKGQLRYVQSPLDEQKFVPVEVDGGTSDRGAYSSIALNSEGRPAIAYRDATARSLRLATMDAAGAWSTEKIPSCTASDCPPDAAVDYGEYAQLVIVKDNPRIVFYDRVMGALKIAERPSADAPWSVNVLDGAGMDSDVGRFAAVGLDGNKRLGVAYFDATQGALRLYRDSADGAASSIVVDSGAYLDEQAQATRKALVGQHPALVFDDKDNAVIVYLDATGLVLKLARVAGDVVVEVRALSLPAGGHIAVARQVDQSALLGAYGAWLPGEAPRTRLGLFTLLGQSEEAP